MSSSRIRVAVVAGPAQDLASCGARLKPITPRRRRLHSARRQTCTPSRVIETLDPTTARHDPVPGACPRPRSGRGMPGGRAAPHLDRSMSHHRRTFHLITISSLIAELAARTPVESRRSRGGQEMSQRACEGVARTGRISYSSLTGCDEAPGPSGEGSENRERSFVRMALPGRAPLAGCARELRTSRPASVRRRRYRPRARTGAALARSELSSAPPGGARRGAKARPMPPSSFFFAMGKLGTSE